MKAPLSVLIFIITGSCLCFDSTTNSINTMVTQDVDGLQRAIYFVRRNYRQFNVDGLLGLVLTEGYLLKAESLIAEDFGLLDVVKRLFGQVRVLRIKIENFLTSPDELQHPANYLDIFDPSKWIRDVGKFDYFNVTPHYNQTILDEINNSRIASYTLENITAKSDDCLCGYFPRMKLMECPEDHPEINFYENICKGFVDGKYPVEHIHGYSLSHYLLIRQIIERFGKDAHPQTDLKTRFNRKLCYFMLKDAETILMNINIKGDNINRDLYLENVVLCGLEGHFSGNFLIHGGEEVFNWQTTNGCFSISPKHFNRSLRRTSTRSAHLIGNVSDYCTDHMTGLGMAAIAAHLFGILTNI